MTTITIPLSDERPKPSSQAVCRGSVPAANRLYSAAKFAGNEHAGEQVAVDGLIEPASNPGISPRAFSKLRQNVGVEQPGHDEIFLGMSRRGAKSVSLPASGILARNDLNDLRVTSEPRVSRRISRCSASADLPCRAARLRSD
jgi:hypothetical protein